MNAFLSVMLSVNLFMSSLISPTLAVTLSPNPFINPSIRYDFTDYESAASYYYSQVVNNSIQYSDSDILTLLCVLANLYVEHKDSLSQDMQDNITYYYEHQLPDLQFWINHDLPFFNMLGYIVKPYSSFFDKGYKWLYSRFKSLGNYMDEYPHVYYFAYLYDNLSFTKTGVDPSPVLESDIKASAEVVSPQGYTIANFINPLTYDFSNTFNYLDLYNSFISDIQSFGSTHKAFAILIFNDSGSYGARLYPNGSSLGKSGNYGYLIFGPDSFATPVATYTHPEGVYYTLNFYNNDWTRVNPSYDFVGKYYSDSLHDITSSASIRFQNPSYSHTSPLNNFLTNFVVFSPSTLSSSVWGSTYFFNWVSPGSWPLYNWLSTQADSFVYFNSLSDFQNYTLANSLYFRSTDVVKQTVSYDTINNIESLYIANETTYNSVNNYVIDNSINNIDNSTQSVINKNYNFNFNFELDFDFNFTINNIKDNEQTEDNYLIDFLHKFDSSGYKDFNFTSFTDSSGSSSSWGSNFVEVRSLMESYYLHLPNKLKMALAGVLVTGLFGLVLSVVSKVRK